MAQAGKSFFKEDPIFTEMGSKKPQKYISTKTTSPSKPVSKLRVLPNHAMSVEDSYLYTYVSDELGAGLSDTGGLEIRVGSNVPVDKEEIVHIHTGPRYIFLDGTLYMQ